MPDPTSSRPEGQPAVPPTITCMDCGGIAYLLTTWPDDDPPVPGDVLAYRCADCADRWDMVVEDADVGDSW